MSGFRFAPSLEMYPRLGDWVRFDVDSSVTVFNGKVELGQGIATAISQIAADELQIPIERVRLVSGDTARCPNEWLTSASISIEVGGAAVRTACAEVREAFRFAVARKLRQKVENVRVDFDGFSVAGEERTLTYWDLLAEVDLQQKMTGSARPLDRSSHRSVGRSVPRRDLASKLAGGAFIHDMELPDLLHGRVLRPPTYTSRLLSIDRQGFQAIAPSIRVVVDGSFVGVCAEREEEAIRAIDQLREFTRWSEGDELPLGAEVRAWLCGLPGERMEISRVGAPGDDAAWTLEASYSKPYIAHASIGPACALAQPEGGRLTVWSHTQGNFILRAQLARALSMEEADITVIHRDGAGCYGHNGADDVALDAALLALAVEAPVKVTWSREDELTWAPFGSAMAFDLKARVGPNGLVSAWNHELWSTPHLTRPGWGDGVGLLSAWHLNPPFDVPVVTNWPLTFGGGGDRNAVPIYEFENQSVVHNFVTRSPLRVSALRSLGAYGNVFAIESFMDEIASSLGEDPVAFRLLHLRDERARAVVQAAAHGADAAAKAPVDGLTRGRGMGFARYKNSGAYCAVVVEISVERVIRVERGWAAVDAGLVVNPDGLRNQIEGGIVQAISWTLLEAVTFDQRSVTSRSWDEYPILGFADVPHLEVTLLDRPDASSLGAGECAAGPTAAAIANALFDALGVRVRDLPLTPERIARCM